MIEEIIQSGIIEVETLKQLIEQDEPHIKILDASFVLPGSPDPYEAYLKDHIEGALFFDIKKIADPENPLPHMLPTAAFFGEAISRLGISNDDLVVLYAQKGMITGPPRAWWSFRAFGHDKVCVLNGGLPAWKAQGYPVTDKMPTPEKTDFQARFRPALVKDMAQVLECSNEKTALLLDARPAERYSGTSPEPREGLRSGHIPNSVSLPCSDLVDSETGKLKSRESLEALFENCGVTQDLPVITSCGSGVTAAALALALHHIGHSDTPVYDGSWNEWGQTSLNTPIEKL